LLFFEGRRKDVRSEATTHNGESQRACLLSGPLFDVDRVLEYSFHFLYAMSGKHECQAERQTDRLVEINLHDPHSMEMRLDTGWVRV
jgi:hypothetical protein